MYTITMESELNRPRTPTACLLAAQRLLRQGYSLREISTLLNLHEAVVGEWARRAQAD
jgi:transposase